jgi:hypothetical protein
MSLVLTAALLASTATLPHCSWDRPGHNPFMGHLVAAVDRYTDIPQPVRERLKARMAKRQYDEIAVITRDSIAGKRQYSDLRDMHFGQGQVCRTVTRSGWAMQAVERGLVYCEGEHCLIVPTVCRNLSRVTRQPEQKAATAEREQAPASGGGAPAGTTATAGPSLPQGGTLESAATDAPTPQSFAAGAAGGGGGGSASSWVTSSAGWVGGSFASLGGGSFGSPPPGGGGSGSPRESTGSRGNERSPQPLPPSPPPTPPDTPPEPPKAPPTDLPLPPMDLPPPGPPSPPGLMEPPAVTPVPEPGTWALMLGGLGLVAWRARRRAAIGAGRQA